MAERAEVLVAEAEGAERELTVVEAHALELRHRMDALGYTEAAFLEARSAHEAVEQERREAEMMGIRALVEVEAAKDALARGVTTAGRASGRGRKSCVRRRNRWRCTMSLIARSPICGPSSICSCAPTSPSWRAVSCAT